MAINTRNTAHHVRETDPHRNYPLLRIEEENKPFFNQKLGMRRKTKTVLFKFKLDQS
jgi:hypothetical protein